MSPLAYYTIYTYLKAGLIPVGATPTLLVDLVDTPIATPTLLVDIEGLTLIGTPVDTPKLLVEMEGLTPIGTLIATPLLLVEIEGLTPIGTPVVTPKLLVDVEVNNWLELRFVNLLFIKLIRSFGIKKSTVKSSNSDIDTDKGILEGGAFETSFTKKSLS